MTSSGFHGLGLGRIADDPRFDFLAELAARGVTVARLGRPIRCPLPDHDDHTASFSVFRGRHDGGYGWRCHGCGRAGDPVTLLAILDGVTVGEWCRRWAEHRTLRPLARPARPHRQGQRREDQAAAPVGYTTAELGGYLARCRAALLHGPDGAAARRYARRRGLTGAEVRRYQLGVGLHTAHRAFRHLTGRLILPCPGGLDARTTSTGAAARPRYLVPAGDPHTPWGLDRLDPTAGPLVIVEGVLDAIALARYQIPAIALRGTTNLQPGHARAIAAAGIRAAYIALDGTTDVTDPKRAAVAAWLRGAGVEPLVTVGPLAGSDFGDLLTLAEADAVAVLSRALLLRPDHSGNVRAAPSDRPPDRPPDQAGGTA